MQYWLNNYRSSVNQRFSSTFIMEAINFILTNNNFLFDDTCFTQILGKAMGCIFAPTSAALTLGYAELELYRISEWGQAVSKYTYENWSRYLDDCEIPLDKSRINPEDLLTLLNALNRKIKFTMNCNEKETSFLDIMTKRDSTLWMDLYQKPTDTQRYVPFNSNHPNHCKRNIPLLLLLINSNT